MANRIELSEVRRNSGGRGRRVAAALGLLAATALTSGFPALASPEPLDAEAPAAPFGPIPSSPPSSVVTTDGWTLALSANSETVVPDPATPPGMPAHEFLVGGLFNGTLRGPKQSTTPTPSGKMEVGYQIQCMPGNPLNPMTMMSMMKPSSTNVKVLEEKFTTANPTSAVSGYRLQVDCMGGATIRSYAILTRSSDTTDSVVAYYGVPVPTRPAPPAP